MDEKEFNQKRDRSELVKTDIWKEIRKEQLEMIVDFSRNYEGNEIKAMLRLIAKTDEWEEDFTKAQERRRK